MFLYIPLRLFRGETTSSTRFDPEMETYEETFLCESDGTETKSKSKVKRGEMWWNYGGISTTTNAKTPRRAHPRLMLPPLKTDTMNRAQGVLRPRLSSGSSAAKAKERDSRPFMDQTFRLSRKMVKIMF